MTPRYITPFLSFFFLLMQVTLFAQLPNPCPDGQHLKQGTNVCIDGSAVSMTELWIGNPCEDGERRLQGSTESTQCSTEEAVPFEDPFLPVCTDDKRLIQGQNICIDALPAFPGAEGGGAISKGGRGGIVYEVTTLDDSGEGSLRYGLTSDAYKNQPRTIVFKVGGYIHLQSHILVEDDAYITVAGQTAPGDGITLVYPSDPDDSVLEFKNVHDVTVQYLRIRKGGGPASAINLGSNLFITGNSYHMIFDHCSLSWAGDENFGLWNIHPDGVEVPHHITFEQSISAESLHHVNDDGNSADSTGFLAGSSTNPEGMTDISVHHNLFSRNNNRNPIFKGASADIAANLIYNWQWMATAVRGGAIVDIVDNVYKIGPARSGALRTEVTYVFATPGDLSTGIDQSPSIFFEGNMGYCNSDPDADGWESMIHVEDENWTYINGEITPLGSEYRRFQMRIQPFPVKREDARTLADTLLAADGVGASRRLEADGRWVINRDQVDYRIAGDYQETRGDTLVDNVDDVGGWPYYDANGTYSYVSESEFISNPGDYRLNSGIAYLDSDHDGMPDEWEDAHGLDKNDESDRNEPSGLMRYTNLELFLSGTSPNQERSDARIFIIGDSTVHRHNIDCDTCEVTEGWGDELHQYVKSDVNVTNRARAGSSAETYREVDTYYGADRYWGDTYERMSEVEGKKYLLIQFGSSNEQRFYDIRYPQYDEDGNLIDYNGDGTADEADEEARQSLIEHDFKKAVAFYIDQARQELNAVPVLLSPPNSKDSVSTRGPYPGYVEALAKERGVAYLDLHQLSLDEYSRYSFDELIGLFGLHREDGSADATHYNIQGATIVGGWVRTLICNNSDTRSLCEAFDTQKYFTFAFAGDDRSVQPGTTVTLSAAPYAYGMTDFTYRWEEDGHLLSSEKSFSMNDLAEGIHEITLTVTDANGQTASDTVTITVESVSVTVYEDAEDGDTEGWGLYGDGEGVITNVYDEEKGSQVIDLSGNGLDSGYTFTNLNITSGFFVSWSMRTSEDFRFFIKVRTSGHDPLYLEYAPVDTDEGYVSQDGKDYVRIGLGSYLRDDRWIDIVRDIQADLEIAFPDETIEEIYGFYMRGNMRIDDIATSASGDVTERIVRVDESVTSSAGSEMNVSIYYQETGVAKPTLYFAAGGGLDHHLYEHLLHHLVYQGYVVVAASYGDGFNDTYIADNFFDAFVKGWQMCEDRGINDDSRTGLIGHSSGAGTLPSLAYRLFVEEGMGSNGRFVFGATPWVDFQWKVEKYLPADTNFVTQWYEDDHDTDPRIYLDMYRHMALKHKSFMIVKQNSDHYTIMNGTPVPVVKEGIYKPLDALANYTFEGTDKEDVFPEYESENDTLHIFAEGMQPDAQTYESMMQHFIDAGSPYPCDSAAGGHYDPNPRVEQCEHYMTGYRYPANGVFSGAVEVVLDQPEYLSVYQEPLFDTNVTRITDRDSQTGNTHPYPKQGSAWNSDGTMIRMQYRLYDAATFEELPVTAGLDDDHAYAKVGSPAHGSADIRWSKNDPNVMFVLDSSQRFKRVVINDDRSDATAETAMIDLSGLGYSDITTGNNEGNLDHNDSYVVFAARKDGNESVFGLLYHIDQSDLNWTKVVPRGVWDGDTESYFDWISVDPTAHYIVVNAEDKTWLYDMNLSNEVKLDDYAAHGDMGIDVNGDPVYVQMIYGGTAIRSYNLRTHEALDLIPSNHGGGHISCRNYLRLGWCYVNTSEEDYKEVFALKLDDHVSGVVERYVQTHVTDENRGLTQVNVSPDGTKILFGSDWGDSNNTLDTYHADITW